MSTFIKNCKKCGEAFQARHYNQLYCSTCKKLVNHRECTCIICGKKFTPIRTGYLAKTCSRTCQGYYIQKFGYGMKYNDEELKARLIKIIQEQGMPLSMEELLRKAGNISYKVITSRKWSLNYLLKEAGYNVDPDAPRGSKFEQSVWELLVSIFGKNRIEIQKRFPDCRNKLCLPFDFYIKDYNLCIEADGIQHYKKDAYMGDFVRNTTDPIKNAYCRDHGIGLLRIQYVRYKTTKEQLREAICQLLPPDGEIYPLKCFNCWNGSEWIPISSQALYKTTPRPKTHVEIKTENDTVYYHVQKEDAKSYCVIMDKDTYDTYFQHYLLYLDTKNRVYWTKNNALVANLILGHKGNTKWIMKYKNNNPCDIRRANLYLIRNKDNPRPKRGLYCTSTTGVPGLSRNKGWVKGKYYYSFVAKRKNTGEKKSFSYIRYGGEQAAFEAAKSWIEEGSTTTSKEGTPKRVEMGTSQTDNAVGKDIV